LENVKKTEPSELMYTNLSADINKSERYSHNAMFVVTIDS